MVIIQNNKKLIIIIIGKTHFYFKERVIEDLQS